MACRQNARPWNFNCRITFNSIWKKRSFAQAKRPFVVSVVRSSTGNGLAFFWNNHKRNVRLKAWNKSACKRLRTLCLRRKRKIFTQNTTGTFIFKRSDWLRRNFPCKRKQAFSKSRRSRSSRRISTLSAQFYFKRPRRLGNRSARYEYPDQNSAPLPLVLAKFKFIC